MDKEKGTNKGESIKILDGVFSAMEFNVVYANLTTPIFLRRHDANVLFTSIKSQILEW